MLNKLKQSLKKLKSSNTKPNGFFCNAFIMCEFSKLNEQDWKLDFYDEKTNTITSYTVSETIIKEELEDKIFKKESEVIQELKLEEVNQDFEKILKICKKELNNKIPDKIIIILQNQSFPQWNISFITREFRLINIKINAITQELISSIEENLLEMQK